MTEPTSVQDLFKGRHFDQEIIILCVRWYITFKLSFRDLVQMMAERGITLSHTTILRWVQQYVPEFEKRWNHYARPVGDSWRVDEIYIKVKGQWVYLYRAVDKQGRTVDFLLRGCLKSPDSRQILSSMCLLQLPESWHEACTTSVNLALAGLFKHPLTRQGLRP